MILIEKRKLMPMGRWIALVLAVVLVLVGLTFAACGKEEEKKAAPAPKEPTKLSQEMKILVDGGGEALLPKLPDGYKIMQKENQEEVKAGILAGEGDIALVSPMTAIKLYEESGGNVLTLSPIKMGGISILYFGPERKETVPSDLSGRRIVTAEEGELSQYVLNQAVRDDEGYSVAYKNVGSQKEVADALKDYNTFALVTEPYASQIMKEDVNVKKIMDVDGFWKAKGHKDIPIWVIVTRKWETEDNQNDMKVFMKDYREATEKDGSKEEGLVFYGKTNRGDGILRDFFRELLELDKNAAGGGMPPEEMFYRMKFPT